MPKVVELFYDIISPYSWFSFEVLSRYRSKWNLDLKLRPVFIGGIMAGSGNRPPAAVPNKAKYMFKTDLPLLARHFNVPLTTNEFASNTLFESMGGRPGWLNGTRLITAVRLDQPKYLEPLTREFFLRIWSKGIDVKEPASLLEACAAAGIPEELSRRLVKTIGEERVKTALKAEGDAAIALGAFGLPYIVAHIGDGKSVGLFGSDRMPVLADVLGEKYEGPLAHLSK